MVGGRAQVALDLGGVEARHESGGGGGVAAVAASSGRPRRGAGKIRYCSLCPRARAPTRRGLSAVSACEIAFAFGQVAGDFAGASASAVRPPAARVIDEGEMPDRLPGIRARVLARMIP